MNRILLLISFLLLAVHAQSQRDSLFAACKDSLNQPPDTSQFNSAFRKKFSTRWHMCPHSPLRASLYSAAIPGAGQIYNGNKKEGSFFRKYWKVPVVYAGFATCIGFIQFNTKEYRYLKGQYIAYADGDPNTVMEANYDVSKLQIAMERHHRWMDVSYMCLAGVYLLQIIDANVDAHLFYFDVGQDLSLNVRPSFVFTGNVKPAIGLSLEF